MIFLSEGEGEIHFSQKQIIRRVYPKYKLDSTNVESIQS